MDRNDEPNLDQWVAERLAALTPSDDWEPKLAIALAAFHHRRNSIRVRQTRAVCVLAGAILLSGLLAFPATRVVAQRCVGACIAGTGTAREFLGKTLHLASGAVERPIEPNERRFAPDFALTDASGELLRLSNFRGRVVLLNFWATWCPPCAVEIPWFLDLQGTYGGAGLVVVGAAMDDNGWSAVRPYLEEHRITYRVTIGDAAMADSYGGLDALPTTFLIDREGRIAAMHTGLVEKRTYEDELKTLLSEH
jgi:peroxiredoxin